jgi:hypothetical protein
LLKLKTISKAQMFNLENQITVMSNPKLLLIFPKRYPGSLQARGLAPPSIREHRPTNLVSRQERIMGKRGKYPKCVAKPGNVLLMGY